MADEVNRSWKDQYMLRLPDGMRDRIKVAAETNGRSMNVEIVTRLDASLLGSVGGGTIDQIFENTISQIVGQAGADRHFGPLLAHYADYKQQQISNLREFLFLASDAFADLDGRSVPDIRETQQRQIDAEFERLRSWANTWGYDVIKRSD